MISEVLEHAVASIDGFLNAGIYNQTYSGELRQRIVALRDQMDAMRVEIVRDKIELKAARFS